MSLSAPTQLAVQVKGRPPVCWHTSLITELQAKLQKFRDGLMKGLPACNGAHIGIWKSSSTSNSAVRYSHSKNTPCSISTKVCLLLCHPTRHPCPCPCHVICLQVTCPALPIGKCCRTAAKTGTRSVPICRYRPCPCSGCSPAACVTW